MSRNPLPQGHVRIYGAENIRRHLQRQKRDYGYAPGSLAPYKHDDARAIARRLRQGERNRERQLARAEPEATRNGFGRSRRGYLVDCAR